MVLSPRFVFSDSLTSKFIYNSNLTTHRVMSTHIWNSGKLCSSDSHFWVGLKKCHVSFILSFKILKEYLVTLMTHFVLFVVVVIPILMIQKVSDTVLKSFLVFLSKRRPWYVLYKNIHVRWDLIRHDQVLSSILYYIQMMNVWTKLCIEPSLKILWSKAIL